MPAVGFVGLGQMGEAMAARLATAGFGLTVLDIRPGVAHAFGLAHGARPADTGAELAADRDVVITMLPNGAVVREALSGEGPAGGPSLLGALPPGAVVIDMSSSAPHETLALGELLAAREVVLIDAPVSGGVRRARDGTLAIMAGGDREVIARHDPLLSAMGSSVVHTGGLGSGHAAKALNNAVSAAGLLAAAEALIVGKRFGIAPQVMLEVLNASTGRNNATENKLGQFVLSRSFGSGFALELLAKDLRIACDLAQRVGTDDRFTAASRDVVDAAERWLGGGADHTEVVKLLEHRAGLALTVHDDEEPS